MFYEKIQRLMDERKLSIAEVARMTGLPDSTIRSIITRKSKTAVLEVASKIAKGLNVSLEYLNSETELLEKTHISQKKDDTPFKFTLQEQTHVVKYRSLDEHGKKIMDFILNEECERLAQLQQKRYKKIP